MNLEDVVNRKCPPDPWREGDKLPWNDPGFSERMLKEHLSQFHDGASRRFEIIDLHVEWLHRFVLSRQPSRVLDLGCGPGLYLQRLARFGHECVGIDYSPASIAYAKEAARRAELRVQYRLEDVRSAAFGEGFDLVMMTWGEFNVFPPADASKLAGKAAEALCDSGQLVLEVHTFDDVYRQGSSPPTWGAPRADVFSDSPHICLEETFWDEARHVSTTRYFIVDAASSSVTAYASSSQAYTDEEFRSLLRNAGFAAVSRYGSLTGEDDASSRDLAVYRAEKRKAQPDLPADADTPRR